MQKEISVIIPVHNEAELIEENILSVMGFFERDFESYEIIVSEDGSTDGSDIILNRLAKKKNNLLHLHSDSRLGKSTAINRALLSSHGRNIFIIDADLPINFHYINQMIRHLKNNDVVVGSRSRRGSVINRSITRTFFSLTYNLIVRLLFRTGIMDHQCGVKAFRREIMLNLIPDMVSKGFFWDTEFLVNSKHRNYSILELPIKWSDRKKGRSKISIYRESPRLALELLRLRFNINQKI